MCLELNTCWIAKQCLKLSAHYTILTSDLGVTAYPIWLVDAELGNHKQQYYSN